MNNTKYVGPKQSAYCPECKRHPQQERTRNHGERLCSSGHVFTLKQSREAKANDGAAYRRETEELTSYDYCNEQEAERMGQ